MKFAHPLFLYLTPIFALILGLFLYRRFKSDKKLLLKVISPRIRINFNPNKKAFKIWILGIALTLVIFTLSGPQWGNEVVEQKSKGIDIVFAIDTSKSMLAEDVKPNRLERTKYAVLDFTKELKSDRIGLVAFAGNAFLLCPLTLDYQSFKISLEGLDTESIGRGGTDIASALNTASYAFKNESNYKIIILISDGEELSNNAIAKAKELKKKGIQIFTVGVGTQQGDILPLKFKGTNEFVRDSSGKVVKSRLDEGTLKAIAAETGGFYVPLGKTGQGLELIYQKGLEAIPKGELNSALKQVPIQRFQVFLGIAIALLVIEMLLTSRKGSFLFKKSSASLIILSAFLMPNNSEAWYNDGIKAYDQSQYDKSIDIFKKQAKKDPENKLYTFNLASSYYKNGNYEYANKTLEAIENTEDTELQHNIFYNKGNTHYRIGEKTLERDKKQTITYWEQALKDYQTAIDLEPEDTNAKENYDFVKEKLDKLKEEQKQDDKQNQEQNKDQQKQEDKDDQKEDKSENNDEDKGGQGEDKEDQNNSNNDNKEEDNRDSNNEGNEPKEQDNDKGQGDSDKNDSQNNDKPQEPKDEPNSNEENSAPREVNESQPEPMSRKEAAQLLQTLEGSEKKLPIKLEGNQNANDTDYKDW